MLVKEIMVKDVISVSLDSPVEECARLMQEHRISGLPVLDAAGRLAGIITEGDLIRRLARYKVPGFLPILGGLVFLDDPQRFVGELRRAMALHVGRLMTRDVITAAPEDTLEKAATKMLRRQVKRLPVIDQAGTLAGIIARRDLVEVLYPAEAHDHAPA
ncbi:MAG: CBS domain-containing protein [Bacillota bacterium]